MVFRIPPPPTKHVDSVGKRHITKRVNAHVNEAERRGLSMAKTLPSTTPVSNSVQWPGHVVDPAWLKANPSAQNAKPVPDWRDIIFAGAEESLTELFNPKQIKGDNNAKKTPVMWEPLTHDFIEALAFIIDRILMEPEFRAKIQVIPGGKVDPQPVIGIHELRNALAPELETLLVALRRAISEGLDSALDTLLQEMDTTIIRGVWEQDIVDGSLSSDVTGDEILDKCLESMDDIDFEKEAARRGFRMVKL
jgi:hypothetical protein